MREEEMLEGLGEQIAGVFPHLFLDALGVVADQLIGHEPRRSVVDHRVGEEQCAAALVDPQHRVVGSDRAHLQRGDVLRQLVAEGEPLDRRAALELVQAGLMGEDRAAELGGHQL